MAGLNRQFVLGEAFDCGPYWNEGPHEVEPAGGAECRLNFNKATDQWLLPYNKTAATQWCSHEKTWKWTSRIL